jgi:hypothetical protein
MIYNIGETERLARVFVGSLLIGWGIFFGSQLGITMFVIGIIPLTTGLVGNCPLYTIFKNYYLGNYRKH